MKDYEDDLVFKWQNKLEESVINSTNTTPEKGRDEKIMGITEKVKNLPIRVPGENRNNYNTLNQRQGWNGNNNWKKPFWKNNWHNNNFSNSTRSFQQFLNRREPLTPPWRNYENQRYDNRNGDTRPYYYDGRREQGPYENHYNNPTHNRYEYLRRPDEGGRTPRDYRERGRTPNYQYGRHDRTPTRFLEMRSRGSPRRYQMENRSRRSIRRSLDRTLRRETRREERHWEQQRERGERSRRSPRRGSKKPSGRNGKQSADVEQEQKNKRKRE